MQQLGVKAIVNGIDLVFKFDMEDDWTWDSVQEEVADAILDELGWSWTLSTVDGKPYKED